VNAIALENDKARIISDKCIDCGFCVDYCPEKAFTSRSFPSIEEQEARIAETAAGIIEYFNGKAKFINLAIDIVPLCDCDPFVGIPIVPDLGVLASNDPVSLDKACVDLVNSSPGIPGSMAEQAGVMEKDVDKFNSHVSPDWRVMLKAAEEAGLGTQEYELTEVNFGHSPKSIEELFREHKKRQKT
jgi:uncharacterized Fe-S center protein